MRYIGVDLHTTQLTVCYLTATNSVLEVFELSEFEKFKNSLQIDDQIAVESTSNSNWFYEECKSLVAKIVVVNTHQFRVIATSCNKTDENDARVLAEFLAKDMLPTSKTKDIHLMHLQSSIDTRAILIKQKTMLKNEIHAIFVQNGLKLKSSLLESNKGLNSIKDSNVSATMRLNLQVLVDMIIGINNQIKILDQHLELEGSKLCGYEHLTQIKGVGCITAIMLLIAIGNINNFDSAKKLCSYFGIVPRVRNSNDTINHGSITKRGDARI
ncbi:MAG: transposase [Pseudomonadota bacterium]|nr:transposase [Pseudomonadota bacterium]